MITAGMNRTRARKRINKLLSELSTYELYVHASVLQTNRNKMGNEHLVPDMEYYETAAHIISEDLHGKPPKKDPDRDRLMGVLIYAAEKLSNEQLSQLVDDAIHPPPTDQPEPEAEEAEEAENVLQFPR